MAKLRFATFNVENLFARPPSGVPSRAEDKRLGMIQFDEPDEALQARRIAEATLSDDARQLTAQVILDTDADFLALQEIDNEAALRLFRDAYLHKTLAAKVAADIKAQLPWLKVPVEPATGQGPATGGHGVPANALRDEIAKERAKAEARWFYPGLRVVDGNDARGIDVGYLSRRRVHTVTSHAHVTYRDLGLWNDALKSALEGEKSRHADERGDRRPTPDDRIFKRDCLEVEIDTGEGTRVTAFICHFKANPPARDVTYPIRLAEATAVRRIIETRFGRDVAHANWIVAGDLNDYVEIDGSALMPDLVTGRLLKSALEPLLGHAGAEAPFGYDVNAAIKDPLDRWTSYYEREDAYCQLDHVILSPALWAANPSAVPRILRHGQPYRATRYRGDRYPRVGLDRPNASDHCPIVVDLIVP